MSDYNFLIESKLSQEQYNVLSLISRAAYEQGLNLYLVGGAVRDLTYGQQVVRDLDFALEGDPQKVLRRLEARESSSPAGHTARPATGSGESLAVEYEEFDEATASAELWFSNEVRVELAQCHEPLLARPGQRPVLLPASIFEDLRRRDFSANAMAISLHPNSRGLLLDPTNGAADIERRELRALHPRSFSQDPSRLYRLLRLAWRLDFTVEERTANYFEAAIQNRAFERLTPDQQSRELRAILEEDDPARVLKLLAQRKLLAGLDKKLASSRLTYEHFSRSRSAAQTVAGVSPYLVNFLCLVEKLSGSEKLRMAKKVLRSGKAIREVMSMESDAKKLSRVLLSSKATLPHQVYNLLSKESRHLLLYLLVYYRQAMVQSRVKNYLTKYLPLRARLPRAELQALGVKPGTKFDQILESVFLDQLDGNLRSPMQVTKALQERAGVKPPPPPEPTPRAHRVRKAKAGAAAKPAAQEERRPAASPAPAQASPAAASKGKFSGKLARPARAAS